MSAIQTAAGHQLRGQARKGVWRRWACERCEGVITIGADLSREEAERELAKAVKAHGGPVCP